jgi:DNA-binding MarR family transcriptional regulator
MTFKFAVINPLLHNELRLKIMVTLDSLESADFVYLCSITDSTRGNLSVQIKTLQEAGYLEVSKSGVGRLSHTVCRITRKGQEALRAYEEGLRRLFTEQVPADERSNAKVNIS